ncbi:DNA polymerase III subunit delta [Suttonella ornithocola]|uniref:DNA polymerase III subunit delta n=1 Tax=Suttonella ornithocola TaxID=279832 RepID=A0A380MP86_9GAMM|nr:DNA polymerase III subunit delta [Suttonella ornithocola]SUO93541.1 DNA polymerase III subunit delta [Suttonella ornithocola]
MSIEATKIAHYLENRSLPNLSLIYGSEPLLNQEALDILRQKAKQEGYLERQRLEISRHADWQILITELESPSLFSPNRLIEAHSQIKKADNHAAKQLVKIATLPFSKIKLILHFPRLDKPQKTEWYKSLIRSGMLEIISTNLSPQAYEQQIQHRLSTAQLRLTQSAFDTFLDYHEGNLLAAQQSIDRLKYSQEHTDILDKTIIERLLDDFSRLTIYGFKNALFNADWLTAYRIAEKIEQEDKYQITLINWHLMRDMHILLQLASRTKQEYADIFKTANIYSRQQKHYLYALNRLRPGVISSTLKLAAKLDRINKGAEPGDPWLTLKQYCLLRAYR